VLDDPNVAADNVVTKLHNALADIDGHLLSAQWCLTRAGWVLNPRNGSTSSLGINIEQIQKRTKMMSIDIISLQEEIRNLGRVAPDRLVREAVASRQQPERRGAASSASG
jgi:hypothetical protein